MTTRYFFQSDHSTCTSSITAVGERTVSSVRARTHRAPPTILIRLAMRVSRAKWFTFLRRVFHYQNSTRPELGSNPFDSSTWMGLELVALLLQISITTFTLAISKKERPVWPMRMWIIGYGIGCFLNLLLLYGRFRYLNLVDGLVNLSEIEQQRGTQESRTTNLMNKCRTSLDLFFAIWFVMGNVWVFDSRFSSFHRAPKLHVLCIFLLAWNAIAYSFPFLLFLLLCCCVPLISTLLGYNMNVGSIDKGASDDQISQLPSWKYKALKAKLELGTNNSDCNLDDCDEEPECCICLAKYKESEEVRELPCSHMFHLRCVDQWLRIISCCPLCKQDLQK